MEERIISITDLTELDAMIEQLTKQKEKTIENLQKACSHQMEQCGSIYVKKCKFCGLMDIRYG
jgi:hypothetical protein